MQAERVGKLYVDCKEMHWEKGQNRRSSKFLQVYYSCIIILSTRYSQWLDICIEKIVTVTNELPLGARGQLPSGSMLSTWWVLKQFAQLLPSG